MYWHDTAIKTVSAFYYITDIFYKIIGDIVADCRDIEHKVSFWLFQWKYIDDCIAYKFYAQPPKLLLPFDDYVLLALLHETHARKKRITFRKLQQLTGISPSDASMIIFAIYFNNAKLMDK